MRLSFATTRAFTSAPELVGIFGLTFLAWFVAELSDGFFEDRFFLVSLVLTFGVGCCAVHLWQKLQAEQLLRRQAEELLRAGSRRQESRRRQRTAQPSPPAGGLTGREVEVLTLLAGGWTNQGIADSLHISLNTVERHTANIYRKLEVRGRVEATAHALRLGLLREPGLLP